MKEKVFARGFKGFDPDMKCRGKQYAENTVFEEEKAEMCQSGMHFCENPLDVLNYYPPLNDDNKFNREMFAARIDIENFSFTFAPSSFPRPIIVSQSILRR